MVPSKSTQKRVRLKPQDPFDLIRLLARSQSDPRKAIAELVQNSLDAGARRIEITWFNEKGERAIRIWDDGEGIFPELARDAALERIARTIGHSHKRDLSPAERREQMVLGRYGIGLIGFWSVGRVMVIKSRAGGGPAWTLRLVEDRPTGEVAVTRARRLEEEATFTEITIHEVHAASQGKIRPPRLQAYLASELRGQLLQRDATVVIHDRISRGKARKRYTVKAVPYLGQPLRAWSELQVDGFESARVELYLVGPDEARHGTVVLSCGGTTVLDDLALVDGNDAPRSPWSSGRLEGVIDFPDFTVAPSTRRGLVHNEPLDAFLAALPPLECELAAHLAAEQERRASEHRESLAKDIRRVFRSVAQLLPEYELFGVAPGSRGLVAGAGGGEEEGPGPGERSANGASPGPALGSRGAASEPGPGAPLEPAVPPEPDGATPSADSRTSGDEPSSSAPAEEGEAEPPSLFPPGPLAALRVEPQRLRIPPLATRGLRARALDADGRGVRGELVWSWRLEGPGELEFDGPRARYTAPDAQPTASDGEGSPPPSARILCEAVQHEEGRRLDARAEVPVVLTRGPAAADDTRGIPEPMPIHAPTESWRSRMRGDVWEFNEAHRDYLAASDSEARRLRYLVHLFAKEVVLRNFGGPGDAELLERMVEIVTCLDGGKR